VAGFLLLMNKEGRTKEPEIRTSGALASEDEKYGLKGKEQLFLFQKKKTLEKEKEQLSGGLLFGHRKGRKKPLVRKNKNFKKGLHKRGEETLPGKY